MRSSEFKLNFTLGCECKCHVRLRVSNRRMKKLSITVFPLQNSAKYDRKKQNRKLEEIRRKKTRDMKHRPSRKGCQWKKNSGIGQNSKVQCKLEACLAPTESICLIQFTFFSMLTYLSLAIGRTEHSINLYRPRRVQVNRKKRKRKEIYFYSVFKGKIDFRIFQSRKMSCL